MLLVGASGHGGQRLQVPPTLVVLGRPLGEETDCVDNGYRLSVADTRLEEVNADAGVMGHAIGEDIPEGGQRDDQEETDDDGSRGQP